MGKFQDYLEVVEPLELPLNGKVYRIPEVSREDGIRFRMAVDEAEGFEPLTDEETFRIFLGSAYDEMIADKVSQAFIQRCLDTAMADHLSGRLVAEIMWTTGGDPKAVKQYVTDNAPNRAARRATNTAAATTTKSPKRGNGTSSRRS